MFYLTFLSMNINEFTFDIADIMYQFLIYYNEN